jgi:hypothetical protein
MYPLLEGYLNHWLTKRVDSGGYQICMCTWESGQDMMKRWGWNQVRKRFCFQLFIPKNDRFVKTGSGQT